MRLCPNCLLQDSSYPDRVRCSTCGHDMLPEAVSQELLDLRAKVNEYEQIKNEMEFNLQETRQVFDTMRAELQEAKDDFEARTTDEAIGRAVRRLGAITDAQVKEVEEAIDEVPDPALEQRAQASSISEDDIPF